METATDPLDALWTPAQREAGRERIRGEADAAARAQIVGLTPAQFEADDWQSFVDKVVADRLAAHDAMIARAAAIMRAPEAVGREQLARHLVLKTAHSAEAAVLILRGAGIDVSALPVGGERRERLAAMRRVAAAGGL